jgi:DNA-binding response OmpR family regulator
MHVMILEDEPLIAMAMEMMVTDEGWHVVGPFASVTAAQEAVEQGAAIDVALLDCNLGGETSLRVAESLKARGIPFAFTSGQGRGVIDEHFAEAKMFAKPIDERRVQAYLKQIAGGQSVG